MPDLSLKDLEAQHELLLADPERYVALKTYEVSKNPGDPYAHFCRHQGWLRLGNLDAALADINASIALEAKPIVYLCRGQILCRLGRYRAALEDFDRAESLDPAGWPDLWGPLHQADCHSRLGDAAEALAACAKLKEDHWTPGLDGAPAGSKQDVIAEVRRRIAMFRTGR
ncbi:MAG TPA: tetratricopeptide repeat protein [Stellaceae bacterium]|nr:tetratricopeptide repeat protein [Stellaceae bacterium]